MISEGANSRNGIRKGATEIVITAINAVCIIQGYGIDGGRPGVKTTVLFAIRGVVLVTPTFAHKAWRVDAVGVIEVFRHPGLFSDLHGLVNFAVSFIRKGTLYHGGRIDGYDRVRRGTCWGT